jgi:hypothetical protein
VISALQCHITDNGQLSVIAPKLALESGPRNVPIQSAQTPTTGQSVEKKLSTTD